MQELYIGLISGTSADGIDAALVDFGDSKPRLLDAHCPKFSDELRSRILSLTQPGHDEINRLGKLDVELGQAFANAANHLLEKNHLTSTQIRAIGSHGQTIRHHPQHNFTLQIADPNIIAARTAITTIADFRRRDMAVGGQGAPLVPGFHHYVLRTPEIDRVIVNIGGVANITILAGNRPVFGYDTGPGNNLMDAWTNLHWGRPYDKKGEIGTKGQKNPELLKKLLDDEYFKMSYPKSTGPEYFNLAWLEKYLPENISREDVQTTLAEFTAQSIISEIKKHMSTGEIIICGGGVHNDFLMRCLALSADTFTVFSSQHFGIDPDWMEAMAFAWLAKQTLEGKCGNITHVTGASSPVILGGVYW